MADAGFHCMASVFFYIPLVSIHPYIDGCFLGAPAKLLPLKPNRTFLKPARRRVRVIESAFTDDL